jgi:hypothetical protein
VRKWVQVDLGRPLALEAVRLVPARPTDFRDTPGFGFPARFKVELSDDPAFKDAVVLADHTAADFANPGDSPVSLLPQGRKARYVRVTAEKLWKRLNDYCFALAEVQVESEGVNVAAGKPVTALDSIEAGRWSRRFLVDGFDSRRQLEGAADPRLKERAALEAALRQAEAKRQEVFERGVEPSLRRDLAQVEADLAGVRKQLGAIPATGQVYAVVSRPPRPIHVLPRGNVEKPGAAVGPGALACVSELPAVFEGKDAQAEGARRVALAEWVASPKNPLTWRSIANRVWHYHFGRGLVDTPNDFGANGSKPTHPELLDWLACEVRDHGSLKKLHRLILASRTYRQVSRHDQAMARADADNRLLWRQNRQRLDAEAIRDSVLAVSGKLDLRRGGPGYELFRFKDDHSPVYDHGDLEKIHDPATYRRTVYRFVVRSVPNPFLDCLDCADPNVNVPVRNTTLTALQALALLNDPFMVRQAEYFAERARRGGGSLQKQVERAVRLALARSPTAAERDALAAHARRHGLANTCRVLFNANEFVFID